MLRKHQLPKAKPLRDMVIRLQNKLYLLFILQQYINLQDLQNLHLHQITDRCLLLAEEVMILVVLDHFQLLYLLFDGRRYKCPVMDRVFIRAVFVDDGREEFLTEVGLEVGVGGVVGVVRFLLFLEGVVGFFLLFEFWNGFL